MGESTEHDVRHFFQLLFRRLVERGVVVSVYGRPPRRHAVDEPLSVFQFYIYPFCSLDGIAGQGINGRGVGMP